MSSKEDESQPLLEHRMEVEASSSKLIASARGRNGEGVQIPASDMNYVTMNIPELRTEFQKELKLQKEVLKRVEEKCNVVLAKIPVLEFRTAEVATLKEELQREKEKRKENQGHFSDLVEKLMEEIVQLVAKNAVLEERLGEIGKGNSSVSVRGMSREQVPAGNSSSRTRTPSPAIIIPSQTLKEPTDATQTRVPEGIHQKALVAGRNLPIACLCGMEFASDTSIAVHIGQTTAPIDDVAVASQQPSTSSSTPETLPLPTSTTSDSSSSLPTRKRKRPRADSDLLCNSYKPSNNSSLEGMPLLSPAIPVPTSSGSVEQAVQSYICSYIELAGSTSAASCSTNAKIPANRVGKHHGKDPSRRLHCLCGLKYRTNVTLYDHIRFFTGMNLLPCKTCGKRFVYASQLKIHLQQVHRSRFMLGCSNWRNILSANGGRGGRKGKRVGRKPITEEIVQIKMEVPDSAETRQDFENRDGSQTEFFPPGGTEDALFCLCNQVSYGLMIACDSETCTTEWFHGECVGISSPPKGKWYCPQCRQNIPGPSTLPNPGSET